MWTVSESGVIVNLSAVRSISVEISDDRQWVEVQVRWADGGERLSLVSLVVMDYGDVREAVAAAWKYVDAIRERLLSDGELLMMPEIDVHGTSNLEALSAVSPEEKNEEV